MLCSLLQQLKKNKLKIPILTLPSSLQVPLGTSGVCKTRLVVVRATKPSQVLPAAPHTSAHRGKSNRGLCQWNVKLCRNKAASKPQQQRKKPSPNVFRCPQGLDIQIFTQPQSYALSMEQENSLDLESGKVSFAFSSAQLYLYCLRLN